MVVVMQMLTRSLYAAAAATAGVNQAQLQISQNGYIVGLQGFIEAAYPNQNLAAPTTMYADVELSLVNSAQYNVNDVLAQIAQWRLAWDIIDVGTATNSAAIVSKSMLITMPGLYIPVNAGDRVYLHFAGATSNISTTARVVLYQMI